MNTTTIIFAGNLTTDAELRFSATGKAITKLRVAVQSRRPKQEGNGWEDGPTTFHNVTVWGSAAENAAESLTRGDRVVVVGRLEQRSYQTDSRRAAHHVGRHCRRNRRIPSLRGRPTRQGVAAELRSRAGSEQVV